MIVALVLALAAAAPVEGERIGNWTVEVDKDPLTDKVSYSAHVISDAVRIDFACSTRRRSEASIYIRTPIYLGETIAGHGTFITVSLRPDDGAVKTLNLRASTETAVATFADDVGTIIATMSGARRLRGRAVSHRGEVTDFDFDITGFDAMRSRIEEACSPE